MIGWNKSVYLRQKSYEMERIGHKPVYFVLTGLSCKAVLVDLSKINILGLFSVPVWPFFYCVASKNQCSNIHRKLIFNRV